jgi:hypothetical protein
MPLYIKGFEISRDKLAAVIEPSKIEVAIEAVIEECLDREGFKYMACGLREGPEASWALVVVLDDDYDEETLRQRPLGELHSSVLWVMDVLEGPKVWERVA